MSESIIYVPAQKLRDFMHDVFVKAGLPKDDAAICADVLIAADERGIDSHGINRLKPIYIDRIKDGVLNPITKIDVVKDFAATAVIDGNDGMGHVIAKKATDICIEKAKQFGIGMVAVRNSSHYGIAGYYPLMCVDAGMIGITGTNARPSIAPTNGIENMLGTNPITFALPTDEDFPFLLDCATSISQRGKIEVYAREGKTLPEGWVIGNDGKAKTDAEEVLSMLVDGTAALVPLGGIGEDLGGYKGYGYATVVEILSAALQGGSFLKMLTGMVNGKKSPYHLGHFFIAINIEAFIELEEFKKTTGDILRELRASKRAPGQERIYTAGEKEWLCYQERKTTGIPLDLALQDDIRRLIDMFDMEGYDFGF